MANIPFAISEITDPDKIRVLLYANNQLVHVSLASLLKPLTDRIEFLENLNNKGSK